MYNEIINKYLKGYSISKLLKEYPELNRRQINKILIKNNVEIRGGRKKKELTEQQINDIKLLNLQGKNLKELSLLYNIDRETLRNQLNHFNIKLKRFNPVNKNINSNYFHNIDTPIKAYWIGFLYTDGSVDNHSNSGRIRLCLQEQDKHILEQFKLDLNIDSKIMYDIRPNSCCCSVEFVDKQIFEDLKKYNIIPNKTYKSQHLPIKQIPEQFLPAFALGLYDGDGSISCNTKNLNDVSINYTAYYKTEVEEFQQLINNLINILKNNKCFFTSAWHCQWRGRKQILLILNLLYNSCPIHLNRKYEIYLRLKNSLN